MKALPVIGVLAVLALTTFAAEVKKVPIAELDNQTLQMQGLMINNINFAIKRAWLGGIKAIAGCTVKNKSQSDLNYTVYLAAFDKQGTLIACFGLEPDFNLHESGAVETLETSGMVDAGSKIDQVLIKVIVQEGT